MILNFALQILSAWHGISDPQQFQSDVYDILDTPSVDRLSSLLKEALSKYRTTKAQALLKKISSKQHQLCYCHTCRTFTAGHVSDQRMEQGMAAIKANGKLKGMLSECNYGEAVSRISQCARDQDIHALKELQNIRQQHAKVGLRYSDALNKSKIAAMKYSFVKSSTQVCGNQLTVKESESSTVTFLVNLDKKISWRGKDFQIVTGTCSYYTSTWMICPCACAAMQRFGRDIDKIENVKNNLNIVKQNNINQDNSDLENTVNTHTTQITALQNYDATNTTNITTLQSKTQNITSSTATS